jgi:CheY-like chemotaxis protein
MHTLGMDKATDGSEARSAQSHFHVGEPGRIFASRAEYFAFSERREDVPVPSALMACADSRKRNAAASGETMATKRPLVSVIDDDQSVRESLPDLLKELGYEAAVFSSAEEFLTSDQIGRSKCLILDVAMPGMSGPDLLGELKRRRQEIPTIFITGQGDATIQPRLMAEGAVECLFKPFSDAALDEALKSAMGKK